MAEVSSGEDTASVWASLTDDLVVSSAQGGMEGAVREAERRGLDVPEVYVAAIDNLPPEALEGSTGEFGDPWDEGTPKGEVPMTILELQAVDGDAAAGAELHKRYPKWYDEQGRLTERGKARF